MRINPNEFILLLFFSRKKGNKKTFSDNNEIQKMMYSRTKKRPKEYLIKEVHHSWQRRSGHLGRICGETKIPKRMAIALQTLDSIHSTDKIQTRFINYLEGIRKSWKKYTVQIKKKTCDANTKHHKTSQKKEKENRLVPRQPLLTIQNWIRNERDTPNRESRYCSQLVGFRIYLCGTFQHKSPSTIVVQCAQSFLDSCHEHHNNKSTR